MLKSKILLLALVCTALSVSQSQAQDASAIRTTYHVQLRYEMWRNGYGYWQTEFTTTDYQEALNMLDLFDAAIESDAIHDIYPTGSEYIITDARMTYTYEYVRARPVIQKKKLPFGIQSYQLKSFD